MTRKEIILEELVQANGAMRAPDLYQKCLSHVEFSQESFRGGVRQPSYCDNFDLRIRELEKDKLIETVKGMNSTRIVVLTSRGQDYLLKQTNERVWQRRLKRRYKILLRSFIYREDEEPSPWREEPSTWWKERRQKFIDTKQELDSMNVDLKYIVRAAASHYYEEVLVYEGTYNKEKLRQVEAFVRKWWPEQADDILQRAKFIGDKRALARLERDSTYRMSYQQEKLGDCLWCKSSIHSKPAKDEADLLAKYSGCETGMLCCACYSKLRAYEEVKARVET